MSTEQEQAALAEMKAHREQLEREAEGIRAATGRIEGELAERRRQVEREGEKILTRARTEADGILAAAEEERRGRLERSSRHDNETRASSPAARQRCHQRCAVARSLSSRVRRSASEFRKQPPWSWAC